MELDIRVINNTQRDITIPILNDDGTLPNIQGSTFLFNAFTPGDVNPIYSVAGNIVGTTNNVLFNLLLALESFPGMAELTYNIIENNGVSNNIRVNGFLMVNSDSDINSSIGGLINYELQRQVVLDGNFVANKILFWQIYLQTLVDPIVEDPTNENSWGLLQKTLIAKLVVYDAYRTAINGTFLAFLRLPSTTTGESQSYGDVKKIVTAPDEVEFFDKGQFLSNLLKPNNNGETAIDILTKDICQLAARLRVYLNMCPQLIHKPIIPRKHKNKSWHL